MVFRTQPHRRLKTLNGPSRSRQVGSMQRASRESAITGKRRGYTTVARARGPLAFGEMKYFDTEHSTTAIPASTDWTGTEFPPNVGTPTTIVNPVVGAAINNRIGRKIKVHKIRVKGVINVPAQINITAGDDAALCRLAFVCDSQTNGSQAQGESIFADPTTDTALHAFSSFQSLANLGRFKVIKDKSINLQNPNLSYDGTNMESQGLTIPFKFNVLYRNPVTVSFNATNGGTIADVVDFSWCLYGLCTSAALVPAIVYQARAYYKE